jgi:hypothetical protein
LRPLLVVQERRRLYRESMTACLKRQLGAINISEGVTDAAELLRLAEVSSLDHAVIEVDEVPWDVANRTRVFAKLGVKSQAQLVAARTGYSQD